MDSAEAKHTTITADEGSGDEMVFQAEYDYRTRRTWKFEKNAGWTHYRYDGGVSFDEWKVNAQAEWEQQVVFARGAGMGGGIGSIIYADRRTETGSFEKEYFVYNAVGHTVATLEGDDPSSVSVKSTNLYEAFGNIVSYTGQSANNRLANTKERDCSTGLDNHGMRYYDKETASYISRDPIGYADGMNVYLYVHSNPINSIDAAGLDAAIFWDGDIHTGVIAEVRNDEGGIIGHLTAEYRWKDYEARDGIWGMVADFFQGLSQPGQVVISYEPTTKTVKTNPSAARWIEGDNEQDARLVDFVLRAAGKDRTWFGEGEEAMFEACDAKAGLERYRVLTQNCNDFTDAALDEYLGENWCYEIITTATDLIQQWDERYTNAGIKRSAATLDKTPSWYMSPSDYEREDVTH